MVELLKQGQYQPLPVEQQILILFAGTNGFVDALPGRARSAATSASCTRSSTSRRPTCCTTIREKCTDGKAFNELQRRS